MMPFVVPVKAKEYRLEKSGASSTTGTNGARTNADMAAPNPTYEIQETAALDCFGFGKTFGIVSRNWPKPTLMRALRSE